MCELFGICSKEDCIVNDYIKEFYSHSNKHPHGWGLACMEGNETFIEKEPMQATKSNYLKERLTLPIQVKNAFAHIRYATIGNIEYSNCHPYTKKDDSERRWTLIHNGTIFEYPPLNKFVHCQMGDTDSERILLYLIEQINEREKEEQHKLEAAERFHLMDSILVKMSKANKLNLLIYDGEYMYVHTNCAKSLYFLDTGSRIIFATVPLNQDDWKPVPFTTLMVYQNGEVVFQGTEHGNEYVETEDDLKHLYHIFSDL